MALQKMDLQRVLHNAAVIHKNPNAIFIYDDDDKLGTISRWNLIGRAVEWLKNENSQGARGKCLTHIFKETLLNIEANLQSYSELPSEEKAYNIDLALFDSLPSGGLFFCFKRVYPVEFHTLCDKILSSTLSQNEELKEIAERIKNTSHQICANDNVLRQAWEKRLPIRR